VIGWNMGWLTIAAYGCGASVPVSPAPLPASNPDWHRANAYLDSAVAAGAAPGAVLAISYHGRRVVHSTGQLGADDPTPVAPNTVYDLASLTKVVGLTTAVMWMRRFNITYLHSPDRGKIVSPLACSSRTRAVCRLGVRSFAK
jgi:CubicO group peptidase (beta-lactamase class C family)